MMFRPRKDILKDYRMISFGERKLRNWAGGGFILASLGGIVSFLWVRDASMSSLLLYIVYIGITIYILHFARVDIFSPLIFFIFFSFIGFGLKLPLLNLFPGLAFFNGTFYHPSFTYNAAAIRSAFALFLVGYVSFVIGFNTVKRGIRLRVREKTVPPLLLPIVSAALVAASFYFRSHYRVGVPGFDIALIEHAGYIYYPLLYGALVSACLAFYTALIKGTRLPVMLALIVICGLAFSEALLGWRGPIIKIVLIIIIIYFYVTKYKMQHMDQQIRRWIIGFLLLATAATFVLYPAIIQYRYMAITRHGSPHIGSMLDALRKARPEPLQILQSLLRRASGLDNLIPIVAELKQSRKEDIPASLSFWANLYEKGIKPEQYYTWHILGVDPQVITTNAPTGWGALYIYGGFSGVIMGMFLIGSLSKFLYLTVLSNILRDGRWVVLYSTFLLNIFWPVVFEGTVIGYFKKHFPTLLFVYTLFILALSLIAFQPSAPAKLSASVMRARQTGDLGDGRMENSA